MPAYRTLLFDLDGTLIDHFKAIHRCYSYTLPRVGVPAPTPLQVRNAVGGGLENAIAKFVPPARLAEAIAIYRTYWHETMLQDVEAMPGALELLQEAARRGVVSGVLTNKLGSSSRLICDHLGFTPFLKAVIGASDTEWLKPEAGFTQHALEQVGGTADSTLLVGDSPYDIKAAHVGGFPAWVVTTGTHSEAELSHDGADRIFPDLIKLGAALWDTPLTMDYPKLATQLKDPGVLSDGEIVLVASAITPGNPERGYAPAIHFKMHLKGRAEEIGQAALRVGWSANLLLYGGHIGYGVEPGYRGNHFAEKAVRLILPVAWANGLPEIVITCNPDNLPSIRTCERLGAQFQGNVPLPPTTDMAMRGELSKNRYVISRPKTL